MLEIRTIYLEGKVNYLSLNSSNTWNSVDTIEIGLCMFSVSLIGYGKSLLSVVRLSRDLLAKSKPP